MAKTTDGEVFAVLTANFMIDSPIKLDVRLIEADCVASPTVAMLPVAGNVDGISFDPWGNPDSTTSCVTIPAIWDFLIGGTITTFSTLPT